MYIKQVIIQGFRSYRDQTVVEPFSPKHNVIVGRNGSGKSNFFYAIQFVLSDEFSHLRADQRQSLLHEGTGPRSLQAFVEIVFDNSDNRLPFDKDEVRLRRMIGPKKDQYLIDGKGVTKQDVMNLLESAGFSRSNPYYIVKQGKINELATAADSYRLKLLREVAGTRVYDERKEESKAILKDTENKREKIDELLKYIDDRLKTLEEEKEELKEYQKWDKARRSLEYTIYDRELQDANRKLEELAQKRLDLHGSGTKLHDDYQDVSDRLYTMQKRLRDLQRRYNGQEEERKQLEAELSERVTSKTQLELTIKDLKDEVDGECSSRQMAKEELQQLKSTIEQRQQQLNEIGPRFNALVQKEQEIATALAIKEQKRRELCSKQGWTERFRSSEERDNFLKKSINKAQSQIREKREQIRNLESDLRKEEAEYSAVDKELMGMTQKSQLDRETIEQHKKKQNDLKQERDRLQNERHETWREETNITSAIGAAKEELDQIEMTLRSMTGKGIMQGIDGVRRVLQTFRDRGTNKEVLEGYYGTLIENFETDKQFRTAVEVTAGNRLFYHIVRHDQLGTKILTEFNKQKLHGEVNFFPLNRLEVRENQYPSDGNTAVPMIEKLRYDPKFEQVCKHVFGRTLICRSMEVATQLARQCGLDCITLEGDQVSHKGSLTGGFYDTRRSRLQLQEQRTTIRQNLADLDDSLQKTRARLNEIESEINAKIAEIQSLETKIVKMRDDHDKIQKRLAAARQQRDLLAQSKEPKERQLANLNHTLQLLVAQKESWERDVGTELLSQLTADEQTQLDRLQTEIDGMKKEHNEIVQERARTEREKNLLENQLQTNLLRKKDELQSKLQEISVEDRATLLQASYSELANVSARISEITKSLADIDEQLEGYYTQKKNLEADLDNLQSQERDYQARISEESKEIEKVLSKQSTLAKKKEELVKKIREVGTLTSDAFEKYQNSTTKDLYKSLEKCNQELKKYENVNKKALDQFVNFSEQKEKLKKRKEELDRGHESILQLIDGLDQRKYDSIQLTFKQVSKYFEEVLAKLAPGARAQLVMRTGDAPPTEESGSSQSQSSQGSDASARGPVPLVEQFTGIGLTVAFSGADETREMQQLSGGQKSLVALALIFAIQKCDPAPFYLFDEIDAAMDPQHRKAVADMIHELSGNAQFITTTFRRELLEKADKFYGVRFRNKVSHIDCVSKEEAADFVEDDTTHG